MDVLPDIHLGPVRKWENTYALSRTDSAVVNIPGLRPLPLRVPLTFGIANRVDALLGARALFVATGSAECGIEATFTIKMSDYKIQGDPKSVADEVLIIASLEGMRK